MLKMMAIAAAAGLLLGAPVAAQPTSAAPAMTSKEQRAASRTPPGLGSSKDVRQMSPQGQAIFREALMNPQYQAERAAIEAQRQRIMALVGAEPLDRRALEAAMAEERRLVEAQRLAQHRRMLAAVDRLAPADRLALSRDARMRAEAMAWYEQAETGR